MNESTNKKNELENTSMSEHEQLVFSLLVSNSNLMLREFSIGYSRDAYFTSLQLEQSLFELGSCELLHRENVGASRVA